MSDRYYESDESYEPADFEPAETYRVAPPRPRLRPRPVRQRVTTSVMTVRFAALSIVAAAVIAGGLAVQMAAGSDPALGPSRKSSPRVRRATGRSPHPEWE